MLKYTEFLKLLEGEEPILEGNMWKHTEVSYKFNDTGLRSKNISSLGDISMSYSTDTSFGNSEIIYLSGQSITKIDATKAMELLKSNKTVLFKSDGSDETYFVSTGDVKTVVQINEKTTTGVKEGMVIYFYESNINEIPSLHNLANVINKLRSVTSKGVDSKTAKEISEWLANFKLSKKNLDTLVDFWSSAQAIKNNIGAGKMLTRTGIFDDIRSLGNKITKLPADKWNPGDIYAIDDNKLSDIQSYYKSINLNVPDAIGQLNLLFSDSFGFESNENPIEGSVVSISLKQEKAQAGKAKEFLKSLTDEQSEYNLTKEEIALYDTDKNELIKRIEDMRKTISNLVKKSETTIKLQQDSNFPSKDETILKKYASIKLAYFLLKDPSKMDENIIKACGFGMSLTQVNPTFFKCVGSSKGSAKIDKFSAGQTITLLYDGLKSKDSEIEIIDLNSNGAIKFLFKIKKGEDHKFVQLTCKPNGNTQATLEIEKITQIK